MENLRCLKILGATLSTLFLVATANSQSFDINVPQPEEGDVVCRAYISEYAPFRNRFANGIQIISNLPEKYCRNGKGVDGRMGVGRRVRVVAVGDFYTFSPNSSESGTRVSNVVDTSKSRITCQANSYSADRKKVLLRHLEEEDCFSGNTIVVVVNGRTQIVHIESVDNFHYAPLEVVQFAETLEDYQRVEEPEPVPIVPASVEI